MAPTDPTMVAPNVLPQRQHVKSQSNNIFDVLYAKDNDDEPGLTDTGKAKAEYIRSSY